MFRLRNVAFFALACVLPAPVTVAAEGPSVVVLREGGMLSAVVLKGTLRVNYDSGVYGHLCRGLHTQCFTFFTGPGESIETPAFHDCTAWSHAQDGAVPLDCTAVNLVSAEIDLKNGGTLRTTCAGGQGCLGSECFNGFSIHVHAAQSQTYDINTVDGCRETISCDGGSGTVEADPLDQVSGCPTVQRQSLRINSREEKAPGRFKRFGQGAAG